MTTSIHSLGLGLLLSLGAGPALAEVVIGYWVISATEGGPRTRCAAANTSDENGVLLTATVGKLGDIQFVMTRPTLALKVGERLPAEFLIDGRTIPLRETKALGAGAVEFDGEVGGRGDGSLLRGLERGSTAVVQMAGLRSTFVLEGTDKAMALLSRCAIDPNVVAAPNLADRDLEAADDFPDEGEETAGWAKPPAGTARSNDDSPVDGLGRAMRDMTTDAAPVAQFQCEFTDSDIFGSPDFSDGKRKRSYAATTTIADDGTALLNGSTLKPMKVDRGTSLRSVGYSARDVLRAIQGDVGTRAPLYGMTEEQRGAYQSIVSAFAGGAVDLVGENRFMVVGVTSGVVGFLDVEPDGSITNQRTPVCLKTQ